MENNRDKNIVLIGFMGAGKTTIGKLLSEKLNRKFIDIDEEIEKEYQMPVTQIFEEFGEAAFREREKSLISSLCEQNGLVLSVGGGAFLQEEIRHVCLSSSVVIFLDISFKNWKDRINLIIDSRPFLQGKTLEEMEELFNSRQEIYENHHIRIQAGDKSPEDISKQIIELV